MSTAVVLLIILVVILAVVIVQQSGSLGKLQNALTAQKTERETLSNKLTETQRERDEARAARSAQAPKKTVRATTPPAAQPDHAELDSLRAENKKLQKTNESLREDLDARRESLREAQAALTSLREETNNRAQDLGKFQQTAEEARQRVESLQKALAERSREVETLERRLVSNAPAIDLERELRRERAKVEEKFTEKVARLEERLRQREERDKAREERRVGAEGEHLVRLGQKLNEARDFIRQKAGELAVANKRLAALGTAYQVQKSQLALANDQIAWLKKEVPAYTPESEQEATQEQQRPERQQRHQQRRRDRQQRPAKQNAPQAAMSEAAESTPAPTEPPAA